jgi:hypothetical protein
VEYWLRLGVTQKKWLAGIGTWQEILAENKLTTDG